MKRHFLAALVLWHALAMLVSSLPSPGRGVNRAYWKDPTVQEEMTTWASLLHADPDRFQDRVYAAAVVVQRVKNLISTPFKPWLTATNTVQSWKMFVAPHRFPARPEIQVRGAANTWESVYLEGDPVATWRRERFATERMRAATFAWGWPEADARWRAACDGFAAELFAERPEIDAVRCRYLKRKSLSAAEVLGGEGVSEKPTQSHVVKRDTP